MVGSVEKARVREQGQEQEREREQEREQEQEREREQAHVHNRSAHLVHSFQQRDCSVQWSGICGPA